MTDNDLKNTMDDHDPKAEQQPGADHDAPENGPASAAPPRIVSEAPLGGVPRRVVLPPEDEFGAAEDMAALDRALGVKSAADDDAIDGSDRPDDAANAQPDAVEQAAPVADVAADDVAAETVADETPAPAVTAPDAVKSADAAADVQADEVSAPPAGPALSPEEQIKQRLKALADAEAGSTRSGATSPVTAATTSPAPEEPAPPPVESIGTASADDWDDDVSPELASVLFGGKSAPEPATPAPAVMPDAADAAGTVEESATTAAAVAAGLSAGAEADAAAAPEPIPAPEPDAPPVELTDIAEVRRLPITAEKRSAPAPDTSLEGRVRYVRVEEPLRNDEGQRTHENWEYLKPDYPGLAGRLVKEVAIEEISYADGSWLWRYERRYTDRGRDRREVRANPDRTYIERADEVSKLDGESGRRLQFKEEAELIFAPPEEEEKRGLLSGLGNLLGRDDEDERTSAASEWRQASSSESRNARKQGGEALKRGFLGR